MPRRRRRAYSTDLTNRQWAVIAPMIPQASPGGRPRKADKREILKAILYFLRAGCAWRVLPHDFPPHCAVIHEIGCDLVEPLIGGDDLVVLPEQFIEERRLIGVEFRLLDLLGWSAPWKAVLPEVGF